MKRATKHEKKMRWLGEHQKDLEAQYAGMWVAIGDGGLVATGNSYGQAFDAAQAVGEHDSLVLQVRSHDLQGVYLIRGCR